MKRLFAILAVVAAAAACAKENAITDESPSGNIPSGGNEIILRANLPQMESKADAVGSFTWAAGDAIAIPVEGGYVEFTYDTSKEAFTFTPSGSETFIDGTAYYPASSRPGGSYSTDFASPEAAKAGFKMEAPFTKGCSELTFTHKSSLIKLPFTCVPPSASGVTVTADDAVVATVALSGQSGSVDVFVPLTPDGSKTYKFALMQNGYLLKEVKKEAVTLAAGTYYVAGQNIEFTLPDLYLLGDGTDIGWSLTGSPLSKNGNVFSTSANLYAGASIRFRTMGDWFPSIVMEYATGNPVYCAAQGDWDTHNTVWGHFSVPQDGYYDIVFDANTWELTLTRKGNTIIDISELYLLGDAADTGWSIADMAAFSRNGNIFTLTAHLNSYKIFRFLTQKIPDTWYPAIVKGSAEGSIKLASAASDDEHFTVDADGVYLITVDISEKTCTFQLLYPDTWYVIGNVYDTDPSSGAWAQDFALTKSGTHWSITINITGEFKFRRYNETTPAGEQWNYNLGLWSAGQLGDDSWYGLLLNGTNIGITEAGRYTLDLEPSNNNMLHVVKVN